MMYLNQVRSVAMMLTFALVSVGCSSHLMTEKTIEPTISMANTLDASRMMTHLQALEKIAQQHGNNRAVGSAGGQASAKYIIDVVKSYGLEVQMLPFENRDKAVGQNIMVEMKGESNDQAVIIGAHYDSVTMGPGINDNGSGVAVLLELIQYIQHQKNKPKYTLYFAFWDSEEIGVAGSTEFVNKLSAEQLKGIRAYINVDMVGTKNPNIMIADGDQSSIEEMEAMLKQRGMKEVEYKPLTDSLRRIPKHTGDLVLEQHLKAFFNSKAIAVKEDLSTLTASDTAPFLGKVPVTSIILFNEQLKGNELEFAPCYHKACDSIDLIDPNSMRLAAEAIVYLLNQLNQQP